MSHHHLSQTRATTRTTAHDQFAIQGHVSPGYEAVREAFAENFARRGEAGGACCAFLRGEKVVDLWGGIRNKQTGEPWEQDTMVVVHSATKGLAAMTLAIAHSRGWLNYEEHVSTYWPEFAQNGKERITVRQLLAHQAGLFAINERVDRNIVANLDRLAVVLARQKHPRGSPEPARRITGSVSASTKASCCAAWIRCIAAWDSFSKRR
jgi:CubicO group peptidase (beta-lactamase class C family)